MTDLLSIGGSGIRAYNAAIAVVGDNVANADTVGYARRQLSLRANPNAPGGVLSRNFTSGNGVEAGEATRLYDALKTKAARNATSDVARLEARSDWLVRLQAVVGGDTAKLDTALGGFWDGAAELAAHPLSTAARTVFLDRADQTASAFRDAAASIATLGDDVAATIGAATREVDGLTNALAVVNVELERTGGVGGAVSNGLLDERDRLLGELGQYLRIGVTEGPRGVVRVTLGEGSNAPALVEGGTATRVGVRDGPAGAELILDPTHGARAVRLPASGGLAGLIEAARSVKQAATAIDGLATRFADAVDAVHTGGVDANGADGTPLFARSTLVVLPGAANAGVATVEVAIADPALLDPTGYVLRRDAGAWILARADGSGAVTGAAPLTLDGVTVTPGPGARDGDSFALPTRTGAAGLALRPLNASQVATSARWLGDAAAGNAGTGRLGVALDPLAAGLPLLPAYNVVVTAPGAADIVDPTTGLVLASFVIPGSAAGAGFGISLDGTPAVGDSFRVTRAVAGSTDTGTIRALLAARTVSGSEAGLDATVAGIASQVSETKRLATSATAVAADAIRANDAVSGVDLDSEAAELSRLQVAYGANAQVIAAARELFDTLLAAVR